MSYTKCGLNLYNRKYNNESRTIDINITCRIDRTIRTLQQNDTCKEKNAFAFNLFFILFTDESINHMENVESRAGWEKRILDEFLQPALRVFFL